VIWLKFLCDSIVPIGLRINFNVRKNLTKCNDQNKIIHDFAINIKIKGSNEKINQLVKESGL